MPSDVRFDFKNQNAEKSDFRWASAPDPAGGAYSAPQTPLLYIRGPTAKGREGKKRRRRGRGWEGKGKGRERKRRGKGGKGRGQTPKYFVLEPSL